LTFSSLTAVVEAMVDGKDRRMRFRSFFSASSAWVRFNDA
jgi:hypothetical protein